MSTHDDMSLHQAIRRLEDSERPKSSSLSSDQETSSQSWDLNTSFVEARELARDGWLERADELWEAIHALAPKIELGVVQNYDVSGDSVDVGRFLSGEPECMITQKITPQSAVSVWVNISAAAHCDAELLYNRGVAVAAVIHALQSSGRGVSLKVIERVSEYNGSGLTHDTEIELQRFGDYINPAQLAFWLAHPAALRRCVFRYNEQQDDSVVRRMGFRAGGGYGYPANLRSEEIPEGVVYIPYADRDVLYQFGDRATALKEIVRVFKQSDVPIDISDS